MRLTFLLAALCATAAAQPKFVRISGTVGDESGARVADACVTLRLSPAASQLSIRANHEGEFVLEAAPNTSYELSFRARGFKPVTRRINSRENGLAVGFVTLPVAEAPIGPDILPTSVEPVSPEPHKVHIGGTLFAREACTLDFDTGQTSCSDGDVRRFNKGADARIDRIADSLYLSPLNTAKLAWGTSRRSGPACSAAHYSKNRLQIDGNSEGTPVCLMTGEGRHAELWLFTKEPCVEGEIGIEFMTSDR